MNDAPHTQGGESGQAHPDYSIGAHRGKGRHAANFGRSIRGARTTPAADQAKPVPPPPPTPPEIFPPGSRGVNPA